MSHFIGDELKKEPQDLSGDCHPLKDQVCKNRDSNMQARRHKWLSLTPQKDINSMRGFSILVQMRTMTARTITSALINNHLVAPIVRSKGIHCLQ
jgi:hypothetical protein